MFHLKKNHYNNTTHAFLTGGVMQVNALGISIEYYIIISLSHYYYPY